MEKLKRMIALALALVMTLSMAVIASAAKAEAADEFPEENYREEKPANQDAWIVLMPDRPDDILAEIDWDPDVTYWHYDENGNKVAWEKIRILTIGNSFNYQNDVVDRTYTNNAGGIPHIIAGMAEDFGLYVESYMVSTGGGYLNDSVQEGSAMRREITAVLERFNGDFDFVVMNDKSESPVNTPEIFFQGVAAMTSLLREYTDAEIYLQPAWPSPGKLTDCRGKEGAGVEPVYTLEELGKQICDAYYKAAADNGLNVSPAGDAVLYAYLTGSDAKLWAANMGANYNPHQGVAGAYIVACVHMETLFGVDARELTYEYDPEFVPDDENGDRLAPERYAELRAVAHAIATDKVDVHSMEPKNGYLAITMNFTDETGAVTTAARVVVNGAIETAVSYELAEGSTLGDVAVKLLDGTDVAADDYTVEYADGAVTLTLVNGAFDQPMVADIAVKAE